MPDAGQRQLGIAHRHPRAPHLIITRLKLTAGAEETLGESAAATGAGMAAKVLIIGPQRCGKTRIANCLSDFEASPNFEQYNQTSGVRILESERVIRVEGRSVRQQVRRIPRASD